VVRLHAYVGVGVPGPGGVHGGEVVGFRDVVSAGEGAVAGDVAGGVAAESGEGVDIFVDGVGDRQYQVYVGAWGECAVRGCDGRVAAYVRRGDGI
jgi:hypothetical protein